MTKWFTIVVCTYNGEKFLPRCLEAIQKLDRLNDLVNKVMVVDNKSTDSTQDIIMGFAKKNSIFAYEYEERQGLSYAREHAIHATTPWVIYVDDDNVLDAKWLVELLDIVESNEDLGVVNGAVIASPVGNISKIEQSLLNVMYKNLACTHMCEPKAEDANNTIPMGAGMCVRTAAIKAIYEEGWLRLVGRSGKKLSSGEDTELSERIFQQGYSYTCCYRMKLYHLIPSSRLTEEYTEKLINGLVAGRVEFLKSQKWWMVKCWTRFMKYVFVSLESSAKIKRLNPENEKYWKTKTNLIMARCFLEELQK